jgi:hypothetical protein
VPRKQVTRVLVSRPGDEQKDTQRIQDSEVGASEEAGFAAR